MAIDILYAHDATAPWQMGISPYLGHWLTNRIGFMTHLSIYPSVVAGLGARRR